MQTPTQTETQQRFNILTAPVGDPEPKITPKACIVLDIQKEYVAQFEHDKLKLIVKHPDRDKELIISSVEYIYKNTVKTSALWVKMDSKNNVKNNTALAHFIQFYNLRTVSEIMGKPIQTTLDAKGYLIIKAH